MISSRSAIEVVGDDGYRGGVAHDAHVIDALDQLEADWPRSAAHGIWILLRQHQQLVIRARLARSAEIGAEVGMTGDIPPVPPGITDRRRHENSLISFTDYSI